MNDESLTWQGILTSNRAFNCLFASGKKLAMAVLLSGLALNLYAGNDRPELNAKFIPDELKKDANAVIRFSETEYEISGISEYTVTTTEAITILGKGADEYTTIVEFYDDWITLESFEVATYDRDGKFVQRARPKDILDYSYASSSILYTDSRVKVVRVLNNNYPYTIIYKSVKKVTNFIDFPNWTPQMGQDVAIQKASLKIKSPVDFKYTTKTFDVDQPSETLIGEMQQKSWYIKDLNAYSPEQYAPPYFEQTPTVMFKPDDFLIDGKTGTNNNWKDLGAFFFELNQGLDDVSPQGTAEIYKIIGTVNNDREKVELLYRYMQKKTRYVAVELGIGGYKSFPASYVEQYGYGDCKALSNYMKSILKVAGINSYMVIVYAGNKRMPVIKDFPSNQFNHAIVCVPLEQDTIWLECTSPVMPCGFLGDFTDNRSVLLLTEDGGKLVRTPSYEEQDNYQYTVAHVSFDQDFKAQCKVSINIGDLQYDNLSYLMHLDADLQKKELYDYIEIKEFTLNSYNFTETRKAHPDLQLDLDLSLNRYISKTGSRIFLPLNLMNKTSFIPNKLEERKYDIEIRMPYFDSDTIIYELPENYQVEFLPESKDIVSEFGTYHAECLQEGKRIVYIRQINRKSGRFPKSSYQDLIDFYKEINKADNQKAMLSFTSNE